MELNKRCNFVLMDNYNTLNKSLWELRSDMVTKKSTRSMRTSLDERECAINELMTNIHEILVERIGNSKKVAEYFDCQEKYLQTLSDEQKKDLRVFEELYIKSEGKDDALKTFLDRTDYASHNKYLRGKTSKEL